MLPRSQLRFHDVLINGVLVGESALYFSHVVVDLLATVLVEGSADGPDDAEDEPHLHGPGEVLIVSGVNLCGTNTYIKIYTGWPASRTP